MCSLAVQPSIKSAPIHPFFGHCGRPFIMTTDDAIEFLIKAHGEMKQLFHEYAQLVASNAFSRFEKLDLMFLGFISFVLVADGLRMC